MTPDSPLAYTDTAAPTVPAEVLVDRRALFGQVMGLVGITIGFTAAGAYIGRDLHGGLGILFFILALGCAFGASFAAQRSQQLGMALLFGMGLLLGLFIGPVLAYYAKADPAAVYQAAGATSLFVAGFGAWGYATRRDLSSWARKLFWLLLGLIGFGLVTLFVAIPGGNVIYCLLGLALFAAYTMFDFNRLARTRDERLSVPIAVSIFLDVFNVFLFFLSLFGGGGRR